MDVIERAELLMMVRDIHAALCKPADQAIMLNKLNRIQTLLEQLVTVEVFDCIGLETAN